MQSKFMRTLPSQRKIFESCKIDFADWSRTAAEVLKSDAELSSSAILDLVENAITTLHNVALHCTTLHYIALHCTAIGLASPCCRRMRHFVVPEKEDGLPQARAPVASKAAFRASAGQVFKCAITQLLAAAFLRGVALFHVAKREAKRTPIHFWAL